MTTPYTGGCACGAIRYEITAEPVGTNDCQCRQCQRESGTGHASHLTFRRADATVEGEVKFWAMTGDGGTRKARAFCPECGSPVYMIFPDIPEFIVLRAASLDDPGRYRPQLISWTDSAQPWDRVDPALPKFARMPPG
jgi:hypothetical protein